MQAGGLGILGCGSLSVFLRQALLKCVSRELEGSFLALQALACLGFIFFIGCSITLTFGTDFQARTSEETLWGFGVSEVLPVCIELLHAMPLPVLYLLSIRVCTLPRR